MVIARNKGNFLPYCFLRAGRSLLGSERYYFTQATGLFADPDSSTYMEMVYSFRKTSNQW